MNIVKNEVLIYEWTSTQTSPLYTTIEYATTTVMVEQLDSPTATVSVQYSFNWVTWYDIPSATFTTSGTASADSITITACFPYVRANISSYTSGTINVYLAARE